MKKKTRKRILFWVLVFILAALALAGFRRFVYSPQLKPGDYTTCLVHVGPVARTVQAIGIVHLQQEVLLLSPYSTLVSKLLKSPGSRVSAGDLIMQLNARPLVNEIELLRDQLEVMENDLWKNKLNARSTRVDLDYNAEVKSLRIGALQAEIADQEQLLKVGGISPALHEQTKQELLLAEKDLKMIREKNAIRLKQLEAEEKGLQMQIEIRRKELESKNEILGKLNVKAPSDGMILAVMANEGERVEKDKVLVQLSDLTSYKIKASIENRYVNNLVTGGELYAVVGQERLVGKIGNISPVVTDKKIFFDAYLDFSHHKNLIPNLEVDLQIVTEKKDSVLRLERGPAFSRSKRQDVYVVRNGKARKTPITTGIMGTDYIEVASGLASGDRVIVSDISSFRHKKEVEFKDL